MELRHLRYFITVAEMLNFRRAAEQLNMTQPPLSQQIQQLERELGFALFHRHRRSVSLTAAGQVFLTEAYRILDLVEKAVQRGQQAARGEVGRIHIGFVESAAYQLLPGIVRIFRQRFPAVDIRLSSMTSNEQLQAISEARLEIGFCRVPDDKINDELQVETVLWEPLCVVLPRHHPLAQHQRLQVRDLAQESFILFPKHLGAALYAHIQKVCWDAGFSLNVEQEATQLTTIVGLVAAGMGVSLLPASVMEVPHSGVVYILLPEVGPVPMSVVWKKPLLSHLLDNFLTITRSYRVSE